MLCVLWTCLHVETKFYDEMWFIWYIVMNICDEMWVIWYICDEMWTKCKKTKKKLPLSTAGLAVGKVTKPLPTASREQSLFKKVKEK